MVTTGDSFHPSEYQNVLEWQGFFRIECDCLYEEEPRCRLRCPTRCCTA